MPVSRIDWVNQSCQLLAQTALEFDKTQPFASLTIGTGIHLEPKTAALLQTLARGGATVVATGNLNSSQPETIEHLERNGIEVIGAPTSDRKEHDGFLDQLMARQPDLLLDNGGDLFARFAAAPYPSLLGGTEETTSGRMRLTGLREAMARPVLVINDSPIKQFAENRHAVGQSIFESYMRFTNRSTNGKRVTVFGYGACGKGVAACFRNAHAVVSVVDQDPVAALEAHFDGFLTPPRDQAIASANVIVTVTGAENVVAGDDADLFKDGVILINGGHFPWEIDVEALTKRSKFSGTSNSEDTSIISLEQRDGRTIHLLADGHMANLAGPRPLGNSIESMDLGFTLQARCLELIARGAIGNDACVVPVPTEIDETVATAYLALHR
ncbi:MAG: adenosylhomocysteinase [Pseudomonadota bacterium]